MTTQEQLNELISQRHQLAEQGYKDGNEFKIKVTFTDKPLYGFILNKPNHRSFFLTNIKISRTSEIPYDKIDYILALPKSNYQEKIQPLPDDEDDQFIDLNEQNTTGAQNGRATERA